MTAMSSNGTEHVSQECRISFTSGDGAHFQASPLKLSRFSVVFETYAPESALRLSEVLNDFKVVLREETIYSGRATVRNLVDTPQMQVCEATLTDASWRELPAAASLNSPGALQKEFDAFMGSWQKLYRITPDYKIVIADMQSFFTDLQTWLGQVEFSLRSGPESGRAEREEQAVAELSRSVLPCMDSLFQKFEAVAEPLEKDDLPAHRNHMRRQLHPLLLCSPFAHRTFEKPLGYAGDYEMVNMMLRKRPEGGSLFAKVVNNWFLAQPPARAHRNRIDYLKERLVDETARAARNKRSARILNLGCGPAVEVQEFLAESLLASHARFMLLDFNDDTIKYTRSLLDKIRKQHDRGAEVRLEKKSVLQVFKDSFRTPHTPPEKQSDFIYCAGLFDYLPDHTSRQLMDIFYEMLAPGGLLISTNVEPSNPLRNGMEHLLDWNLIYRTGAQMRTLKPRSAPDDNVTVLSDVTGVNVMLEVRKPENG
jgi:extracellular factor (EF) 3-hydroxypalmitic acid methyl ester biosynthesis protein